MNSFRYIILAVLVGLLAPVSQAIPQGDTGKASQNSEPGPSEAMLLAADCVAYAPHEQSYLSKSIRGRALACLGLPHTALSLLNDLKEQLPGIEVAKQQVANANLLLIESENCDRAYARLHSIPQTAESTYSNFVGEIHQIARLALVTNLLAGDAIKIGLDLAAEGNPIVIVRLSTKWSQAACQSTNFQALSLEVLALSAMADSPLWKVVVALDSESSKRSPMKVALFLPEQSAYRDIFVDEHIFSRADLALAHVAREELIIQLIKQVRLRGDQK